jgi:hypothetical protein
MQIARAAKGDDVSGLLTKKTNHLAQIVNLKGLLVRQLTTKIYQEPRDAYL